MDSEAEMNRQDELILEKAKTMVDITRCPASVRVTVGPGWNDGIVSPETVCCFYVTWAVVGDPPGRAVSGCWIGWN